MPRFRLQQYSMPDYRSSLPQHDPNNAIWPRISMLAKMLNEIPWFKESTEETEVPTEEELGDASSQASAEMDGYTHEPAAQAEHATDLMKGYAETRGEGLHDNDEDMVSGHIDGRSGGRTGGDRGPREPNPEKSDKPNVYSLKQFDIDTDITDAEMVKNIQKELHDLGYDLGAFGPNKDGIDGSFGGKSSKTRAAYEDWKSKNMSSELDDAEKWAEGDK